MSDQNGKFKTIVDEAIVDFMSDFLKNITHYNKKCKNGILKYSSERNGYLIFPFNEENLNECNEKRRKLVIVLESPHIDEYFKKGQEIAEPVCANGKTGENIIKCKDTMLVKMGLSIDDVDIFIINAIPYQCSQGVSTEILRDFVWLKCWYDFGHTNLLELLKKTNPDYIVNCCTVGSHTLPHTSSKNITKEYIEFVVGKSKNEDIKCYRDKNGETEYSLRGFVNQCIANYAKENTSVLLYQCTHPCTWKTFKKANLRKIELN